MVQTVFYYASMVLVKFLVYIISKILALKKTFIKEAPREERLKPQYGWFESKNTMYSEIVWVGRATGLTVSIPQVAPTTQVVKPYQGKPPVRLYFTVSEAASKDWFKQIEELAEMAEKTMSESGE